VLARYVTASDLH